MKPRLLELLRCPACRGSLMLEATMAAADDVDGGTLTCVSCSTPYAIRDGVPRMLSSTGAFREVPTARTATSFGYLWSQSPVDRPLAEPCAYHFEKLSQALDLDEPNGLVLDAGCGDGIDLANHATRAGVEVVGVELSDGGCLTSASRVTRLSHAHVVQADLRHLPFADGTFDRVYSYGVLHHTASPPAAAGELARVSRVGAEIAIYLYEDFAERATPLRLALALVNRTRAITTKMPHRLLYALCQISSPLVYLLCTAPYRLLRLVPALQAVAEGIPFRHGQGPFKLTGDLYDRFSAPLEYRYSRSTSADLLRDAGLTVTRVGYDRGWMVAARQTSRGTL